jgi:guanylate kinase
VKTDLDIDAESLGGERTSVFLVLSGPGGTGKTTLIRRWLAAEPDLGYIKNTTTRDRRPVDPTSGIDDDDWFDFVSTTEFRRLVEADHFVQWANATKGYCSGTPIAPIHDAIAVGQDLVFDYTPQLYLNLRRRFRSQTVGIFVVPPTFGHLKSRIAARAKDDAAQHDLKLRMALQDLAFMDEHEYVVVNDDLEVALSELSAIRTAERCRRNRLEKLETRYKWVPQPPMLFYYDPDDARLRHIDE